MYILYMYILYTHVYIYLYIIPKRYTGPPPLHFIEEIAGVGDYGKKTCTYAYIYVTHIYACGPKTVLAKCTFLETPGRRLCWGGVGGHVNVPCSANIRCCYAAEISGFVATLQVATLQRSQTPKNTQIWTSKFPTFRVTTMVASLRQNTIFL